MAEIKIDKKKLTETLASSSKVSHKVEWMKGTMSSQPFDENRPNPKSDYTKLERLSSNHAFNPG